MLSVLTGMVVAPLHVLAMPHHLHALAPRSAVLPPRGGTTGGYWGLAHGVVVMALGLLILLGRLLLGLSMASDQVGLAVGIVLITAGITVAYRSGRVAAHDHPHMHGEQEHRHIHLHAAPDQVHDHDEPGFGILDRTYSPSNLVAALPALLLPESASVLYLVSYLVFATLAMGGLGYWLGHARRRAVNAAQVLQVASFTGYAAVALGFAWIALRWPF